ncbi:hypothetical protein GCM10027589_46390 [Actinocorallia lasiicapitis]
MKADWAGVPVGDEAHRWRTVTPDRTVLAVVHNITSLTRLLDVVTVFDDDPRVQVVYTWTRSSVFTHDVAEHLHFLGAITIPWDQARALSADLAITTSYGGELYELPCRTISLSHGMGYNKKLATPDTGHRTPDTGHRTPDTGHRTPDSRSSGSAPNGCCMRARRSPTRSSCRIPSSSPGWHATAPKPCPLRSSRAIPATTASSRPSTTGPNSAAPWASPTPRN